LFLIDIHQNKNKNTKSVSSAIRLVLTCTIPNRSCISEHRFQT